MPVELTIVESVTELETTVTEIILESSSTPGPAGPGVPTGGTDGQVLTKTSATDYATAWEDPTGGAGGGAPDDVDYLVGTASGDLSAEIVVGTSPGGELGGTWASPTVDATHSGSAHHNEDHASRHEDGGADELETEDLATAETDTDLRLAPDGAGGVVWATAPAGGAGSGNVLAEPQSGAVFIPSLGLGDRVPSSPGTYDEEFDGTADTLPTNWAWTSAPSGSDAWYLNSRWPSLLTVEGTGNTLYTLTRTSFSAAATFGIWVKFFCGPFTGTDVSQIRLYVSNSGGTEQEGLNYRATGGRAAGARGLKIVSSVESVIGTELTNMQTGGTTIYMGMVRASNAFEGFYSRDGISWDRLFTSDSHTITIDRFLFKIQTTATHSMAGVDWIRYRTDNDFPRP